MTLPDLLSQIERGAIEPLYLFVGPEALLRKEALDALTARIDEGFRVFNIDAFSAASTDVSQILDIARQLPMMSERRLVIITEPESIKDTAEERLEAYLKAPSSQSTVIFVANSLDMRRKAATAISKACAVVRFDSLSDADAVRWAEARVRERGCQIERSAAGALVDLTGPDLSRLAIEIDKLTTHAGRGHIGLASVQALVMRARDYAVWDLTDAVVARDRKRALRVLARQLDSGEDPLGILGMLASTYRKMLLAKELMTRRAPPADVQAAVKLPPWKLTEFNGHVRRLPVERIVHALRRMAEVDLAIKSSVGTPRLQIEVLVCELTL